MNGIKVFLKYFAIAFCAFLCFTWVGIDRNGANYTWVYGVLFFGITFWTMSDIRIKGKNTFIIAAFALVFGSLFLPALVILPDIRNAMGIIASIAFIPLAICLGAICERHRNYSTFFLSFFITVLYVTFVIPGWERYLKV